MKKTKRISFPRNHRAAEPEDYCRIISVQKYCTCLQVFDWQDHSITEPIFHVSAHTHTKQVFTGGVPTQFYLGLLIHIHCKDLWNVNEWRMNGWNWRNLIKIVTTIFENEHILLLRCGQRLCVRIPWCLRCLGLQNIGWIYCIYRPLKFNQNRPSLFEKNCDFAFGPLEGVPLFSWRYHLCSFIQGDVLHKLVKLSQNRFSYFLEYHNFIYRSPEYKIAPGTDL
jgi:hypothetical protein